MFGLGPYIIFTRLKDRVKWVIFSVEKFTFIMLKCKIFVLAPPVIMTEDCPSVVGAELGDDSVQIYCRFKVSPDIPKVTWTINTTRLEGNRDSVDGMVTSMGVSESLTSQHSQL